VVKAQLEISKAKLQKSLRDLERTSIYLKFNGRINDVFTELDQFVATGTPLFNAFGLEKIIINAQFPVDQFRLFAKSFNDKSLQTTKADSVLNMTDLLQSFGLTAVVEVAGSGFNNWGATPDAPFYTTDTPGVIVSYVNLVNGEIKFRENNDWAVNYGDDGSGSGLALNGGNIAVTAGSYKVTLDLNNLTYAIEDFTIGIVGSSYNNWGASPDFGLTYDPYSDVFRGIVTLLDGEMKFRMNNDWGTNYGDDGVDGVLDLNGANIATTAGIYIVTVNLKDLSYSLEEITSVWGIVGSAYNNWGATPDAQFSRDWSQPFDDIWILKDVTLLDGEYKIRSNNDWGTNYGDDGADGTLELNGANIVSVAGTYTIVLDFTDPANPTYTVN
ncbi:MAG: hypothetical protein JKZ00_02635, partial [Flavobacteriaceae bacterium]|nr:hypothetical protein [Flavobacteriaceae bacterium]